MNARSGRAHDTMMDGFTTYQCMRESVRMNTCWGAMSIVVPFEWLCASESAKARAHITAKRGTREMGKEEAVPLL